MNGLHMRILLPLSLLAILAMVTPAFASTAWYHGTHAGRDVALHLVIDEGTAFVTYLEAPPAPGQALGRHVLLEGRVERDAEGVLGVRASDETHVIDLEVDVDRYALGGAGRPDPLGSVRLSLRSVRDDATIFEGALRGVGTSVERTVRLDDGSFDVTTRGPFFLVDPWRSLDLAPGMEDIAESVALGLGVQKDRADVPNATWWDERIVEITTLTTDLVSARTNVYSYTGGAHPNTSYATATMHRGEEGWRSMTLCEALTVLQRPCDEPTLRAYIMEVLTDQGATWAVEGSMTGEEAWVLDAFTLSPQGVHFRYAPYLAGPYVQGTFDVRIPWNDAVFLPVP